MTIISAQHWDCRRTTASTPEALCCFTSKAWPRRQYHGNLTSTPVSMGCSGSLLPFPWLAGSVRSQPAHPTQSIFNRCSLHAMTFDSPERFLDDTESWIYEVGPGRSMLTSRQHFPVTLSLLLPDKATFPNPGFLTLFLFPETTRLSPFLYPGLSKVISFTLSHT